MNKKKFNFLLICFIVMTLYSFPVFAEELYWDDFDDDTICILTPEGTLVSRDEKKIHRRNEVLSTAIAEITNEGNGNLGIMLHTMAHRNVDKIRQQAFLDRWIEERHDWANVATYKFVATKDEYPDGLNNLISTLTIENQQTGYFYRVRGLHAVWLNEQQDAFSTKTDGVLLTPN